MSHVPPLGIDMEAAASRLSSDATSHSPPVFSSSLLCLESFPRKLFLKKFGSSYSNLNDEFIFYTFSPNIPWMERDGTESHSSPCILQGYPLGQEIGTGTSSILLPFDRSNWFLWIGSTYTTVSLRQKKGSGAVSD